jgi:hypothetical protein
VVKRITAALLRCLTRRDPSYFKLRGDSGRGVRVVEVAGEGVCGQVRRVVKHTGGRTFDRPCAVIGLATWGL